MKIKTIELKKAITSLSTLEEKVQTLKNAYRGERIYILTCGPSINDFPKEYLYDKLREEIVVSVKQTYRLVKGIADFHLLNSWNHQIYTYEDPEPIILMERSEHDPETPGIEYDMLFKVIGSIKNIPRNVILQNRLAIKRNFEDYLFEKMLGRPWGPGIMYELGFYLAVHLGGAEIITLGWDIGEFGTKAMPHFYNQKNPQILGRQKKLLLQQKGEEQENMDFCLKENEIYNEPGFIEEEVKDIAESTKELYYWLQNKNIQLKVVSSKSLADKCIPRTVL